MSLIDRQGGVVHAAQALDEVERLLNTMVAINHDDARTDRAFCLMYGAVKALQRIVESLPEVRNGSG